MIKITAAIPARPIELPVELRQDFEEMCFSELGQKLSQILSDFGYLEEEVDEFLILAWYRDVDDRPIYVDCALCWARLTTIDKSEWMLVHMAKNPNELRCEWGPYLVCDDTGPYGWFGMYDSPPNNNDVDAYFGYFEFVPVRDFRRYASFLDEVAWRAAFGEGPTKAMTTGIDGRI